MLSLYSRKILKFGTIHSRPLTNFCAELKRIADHQKVAAQFATSTFASEISGMLFKNL